jgi:hypothetical protein
MSQGGERSPKQTAKDGDANQHEKLIERQLFKESKWRYRPLADSHGALKRTIPSVNARSKLTSEAGKARPTGQLDEC